MIDDDDPAPEAENATDADTLLYDYFKHLTSLCLLSLGGVLALADKMTGRSAQLLIGALIVIGLAALLSFVGAGQIVEARFKRIALHPHVNLFRIASPMLLSVGIGMFVYLFTKTLKL